MMHTETRPPQEGMGARSPRKLRSEAASGSQKCRELPTNNLLMKKFKFLGGGGGGGGGVPVHRQCF